MRSRKAQAPARPKTTLMAAVAAVGIQMPRATEVPRAFSLTQDGTVTM